MINLKDELKNAIKNNQLYDGEKGVYLIHSKVAETERIEDIIAKGKSDKASKNEYNIANYLSQNRVNVPKNLILIKPDPISEIVMHPKTALTRHYFAFQKVAGVSIDEVKEGLLDIAIKQYENLLRKTLNAGICPIIPSLTGGLTGNPIFSYDRCQTYLTDFEGWHYGTVKELELARKKLLK